MGIFKNSKRRSNCPISFALDIFGDKWTLLIVRDLIFKDKSTYGEFLKSEEGMATNILADRLRLLEHAKIIKKIQDKQDKRRDIYKLTTKGIDLLPILVEIILWSAKYDLHTAASKEFIASAQSNKEKLLQEIKNHLEQ
jgi:DNA-binding HxlR family transcriptional regulator